MLSPTVYNEMSPGNAGSTGSFSVRGAVEFPAVGLVWMLGGDYRSLRYPHYSGIGAGAFTAGFDGNPCPHAGLPTVLTPAAGDQGCVTVLGGYGQIAVPSFTARDTDYGGRLSVKVAKPRLYLGVGYLHREGNYGFPKQDGYGFGADKLPDLERPVSVYGSVWYYPTISGTFGYPPGAPNGLFRTSDILRQRFLTYRIGGTWHLANSRFFLDAGFLGDAIRGIRLSPSNATHAGAYVGLGLGSRTRIPR